MIRCWLNDLLKLWTNWFSILYAILKGNKKNTHCSVPTSRSKPKLIPPCCLAVLTCNIIFDLPTQLYLRHPLHIKSTSWYLLLTMFKDGCSETLSKIFRETPVFKSFCKQSMQLIFCNAIKKDTKIDVFLAILQNFSVELFYRTFSATDFLSIRC